MLDTVFIFDILREYETGSVPTVPPQGVGRLYSTVLDLYVGHGQTRPWYILCIHITAHSRLYQTTA